MHYDIEKLIDILNILFKNGQQLTKLRVCKLLFFIDKLHLQRYGRLVLNDRYYSLDYGPVPSLTLDLLNEFFDPEVTFAGRSVRKDKNLLKDNFKKGKLRDKYDMLIPRGEIQFNSLSESEVGVIEEVLQEYGRYSTGKIVNISHNDATWQKTATPHEIDYELFLEGLPEERKKVIRQLLAMDKEDDLIITCLNK